jgi:hypothetical protein
MVWCDFHPRYMNRPRPPEREKEMAALDPVDREAFDEGFEQAYRAIRGNRAYLPYGPWHWHVLKDCTAFQSGIIAGIAAATGLLAVGPTELTLTPPNETGKTTKRIDHERREGGAYDAKPPLAAETRQRISKALKAFNRKTGAITRMGNAASPRSRPGK